MVNVSDIPELRVLISQSGPYRCALPLAHVIEVMRPQPIQSLANMPAFVRGVAVVRGEPIPVVDLACLLGETESAIGRFVVVRAGERRVALAVQDVISIRALDATSLAAVPPLLQDARPELIAALGSADEKLLVVLKTARILSGREWEALAK